MRSECWRTLRPTRCGTLFRFLECRDALLPLLIDQLSGQLDDNSSKPDHEACSQLLSSVLEVLDRKDVVSVNCGGCKLRFNSSFEKLRQRNVLNLCFEELRSSDVYSNRVALPCSSLNLFAREVAMSEKEPWKAELVVITTVQSKLLPFPGTKCYSQLLWWLVGASHKSIWFRVFSSVQQGQQSSFSQENTVICHVSRGNWF